MTVIRRFLSVFALLAWPSTAHADTSLAAAAGLQAVTAHLDATRLRYGRCAAGPCALTDEVAIKTSAPADVAAAQMTTVQLAGGKQALWVHVPTSGAASWDAVLVGSATPLVFGEQTGLVNGQPGDMSGRKVKTMPDGSGHTFIVRGTASESYSICGREVLAYPEILDPRTLQWVRASFMQLSADDVADATAITATARPGPADKPLAPLLAARFASSGEHPAAIADGDATTVWTQGSVGKGRGEFLSFNAPSDVPITKLAITVAPSAPAANGAAPKTLLLATRDNMFSVTMPEDAWQHPGRAYDIALPQPIQSSCLALVLDDAFVRPNATAVSIAELTAYSEMDAPNATLDGVAADLGAGGRRAEAAAGVLKRAGGSALAPIRQAWPKLDGYGHELALDVAAAAPCGSEATQVFLRGLCDADRHVARKAESALLQCKAKADIVAAVQGVPDAQCGKVSQVLALLGGPAALEPLVARLAAAPDPTKRGEIRHQVATAAQHAPAAMLAAIASSATLPPFIRLEVLRAMGPRLREIPAEASAALDALLGNGADMPLRYLALEPLSELVKAGNVAARGRFAAMLTRDSEWPVRAHAAELAKEIPALQPELVGAIDDPQPRVRQAALETVAALQLSAQGRAIEKRLTDDPWTFVRVASANVLRVMPAATATDQVLATTLAHDAAPQVRVAVLGALAAHRARAQVEAVRARLDDAQESSVVRVEAIRALGAMCDAKQVDRLTELASNSADPMASADDLMLGLAAVVALGDIHPSDLARRLAKLRDRSVRDAVRNAAEHALASPSKCQP